VSAKWREERAENIPNHVFRCLPAGSRRNRGCSRGHLKVAATFMSVGLVERADGGTLGAAAVEVVHGDV